MSGPIIIATLRRNARERLRLALDTYQGHDLVDLRIVTQLNEATGDWIPTRKGVCINVASLPALAQAFRDAEIKARELGLIGGEA